MKIFDDLDLSSFDDSYFDDNTENIDLNLSELPLRTPILEIMRQYDDINMRQRKLEMNQLMVKPKASFLEITHYNTNGLSADAARQEKNRILRQALHMCETEDDVLALIKHRPQVINHIPSPSHDMLAAYVKADKHCFMTCKHRLPTEMQMQRVKNKLSSAMNLRDICDEAAEYVAETIKSGSNMTASEKATLGAVHRSTKSKRIKMFIALKFGGYMEFTV